MAEGILIGAIVGAAYNDLYNVAKDAVSKMVWCKKYCNALAQDLDTHMPIFSEICRHLEVPACVWEQRLLNFKEKLEQGRLLVESCIQISLWHPIRRIRYSRYILKLRQEILLQLRNLAAFNTLLLQQLHVSQQDLLEQQNKLQREAIDPLIATMNGNATLFLDWVRQANSTGTDEGQSSSGRGKRVEELQVDQFLVGVDNPIARVKSLLLSGEGKMVTIVGGMGGIGKTTLAKAICKDPQVREFFGDRIHFFTVSQTPDMMGLLSTIWQEVVEESVPLFQNEEDAYRQLKDRLHVSMPSEPRLLVLDDVWSKANLENLLFEVKRCRTLITTRQAPTLETHHSHTYTLGLLSEENAQNLFCYWAFGQESIPPWADETLVKEVISECKCLPLALKVIGGSLSGSAVWFPIEWHNARDKLRQAEPLGDYHKDALQRRLQASIDALDPKLQECFLDLGAYPEDSKCSADTLLNIWVYVRGMEWQDAVLALAELGSRCLLDFHTRFSGDDGLTLEYGSASALLFSQHDVMRDLALYLGRKDHPPSQRARLLMPQKGRNIPKDWLSEAPLAAQIVSIYTGDMTEQDWSPTLAFPFTEALLLNFDGDAYHIPHFVQSMCKLKVMSIRSSKRLCNFVGSLGGGLSQLQSIDMENVALNSPHTMPKLEKLRVKVFKGADRVLSMLKSQNLASLCVRDGRFRLPNGICQQLSSLQLLNLSGCYLYKLPEQLGNLTNLVCLSLRICHELRELPASLCDLQCLEVLEIRHCSKIEKLPQNLGKLSALKELSLGFCEELRDLPTTFGQLVALKKLYLRGCNGMQDLPANFGLLRSLENLVLDNCSGLKQLPQNFGQLSNLKQLTLDRCLKLRHLPESFVQLSCLKKLSLSACSGIEMLPESFANQRLLRLEDLSLDNCTTLGHLPQEIGQLSCLRRISLQGCSELQELPESFGELSRLEYLSLKNCKRVKHLPRSFGQLRRLKELDLMGASKLRALPENFGQSMPCLEVLGLGGCKKLKGLPKSFGELSELRRWEMVGVGLKSLPASVAMGLVGLESVKCSESLMPLWKAVRGDMAPHPQTKNINATIIRSRSHVEK